MMQRKAAIIGSWIVTFISVIMSLLSCNNGSGFRKFPADAYVAGAGGGALVGAGSSFDNPLFSKMFYEYHAANGLEVNYQSIGSGGGISQLINRTIDFGASDVPMNREQDSIAPAQVLHIPITASAIVLSYNLPEVTDTLRLSPEILAGMFLGRITRWDDTAIVALNPGIRFPSLPIIIAHRSDGSGTTNVFTGYLSKVSGDWKAGVGRGSSVNWPAGLGGKGNEGVAGLIRQMHGAIGYIELAYVMQNKMTCAKIRNKAGHFIAPDIPSVAAAASVRIPADSKISLTDTDAGYGYPISAFSWVLIYKEQDYRRHSKDKAVELVRLISWMIHEGQQYSTALYYSPLPPAAVSAGEAILRSVTYDGMPILNNKN